MATTRKVQTIAEDLRNIEFETSEDVEITPTFDGLGLREDLLRGIYAYGEDLLGKCSACVKRRLYVHVQIAILDSFCKVTLSPYVNADAKITSIYIF